MLGLVLQVFFLFFLSFHSLTNKNVGGKSSRHMRTHLCFDAGVICNRIYSDNVDRYIPTAGDRHTSSEDTTSNHDHHISQMLFVVGRLSFTRCHGSHKPGAIPAFRRMVTALRLSPGLTNLSTHITAINIRVDIVAVVLAAA